MPMTWDDAVTNAKVIGWLAVVFVAIGLIISLVMFGLVPLLGFDGSARFAHTQFQVYAPYVFLLFALMSLLVVAFTDGVTFSIVGALLVLSVLGGLLSWVGVGSGPRRGRAR